MEALENNFKVIKTSVINYVNTILKFSDACTLCSGPKNNIFALRQSVKTLAQNKKCEPPTI